MNKREELYDAIVLLCQDYGFTTSHTYELISDVIDSIQLDDEGDEDYN
jgi:hypothetical protein